MTPWWSPNVVGKPNVMRKSRSHAKTASWSRPLSVTWPRPQQRLLTCYSCFFIVYIHTYMCWPAVLALASTHRPVTSLLGHQPGGCSVCWLELCQIQQTRVISACWPILQRANCQRSRPTTVQYRRVRRNRSQTFVVLWLKITFHITLSQLKSINHISRDL